MLGLELICRIRKVSYTEIAIQLGLAQQTVNDWAKRKKPIPLTKIKFLSEHLDVEEDILTTEFKEEDLIDVIRDVWIKKYQDVS